MASNTPGSYTDSDAISAVTGSTLDMGSNDITTTGKIKFANMYANIGDLPSATTYHGMFAHVHSTGKAYYAHGGNWVDLANEDEVLLKSGGTMAGDLDMGGGALHNFSASVNAQTGTSYTLASSDRGKVLTFENASDITVTVAPSLGAGFSCTCIQLGGGQVIFAAGSGVTISNRQSHTKIAGNKGMATLASYAADTFILCGDTAQ